MLGWVKIGLFKSNVEKREEIFRLSVMCLLLFFVLNVIYYEGW